MNNLRFDVNKTYKISNKLLKVDCKGNKCYAIKKTDYLVNEKYKLLYNQGVNNILYPIRQDTNSYVIKENGDYFLYLDYLKKDSLSEEYLADRMLQELSKIHEATKYKKVLNTKKTKLKMEEIYEYLLYKFDLIESFVRSVENKQFNENSIIILKNYRYILDTKKIMARLQKKIIIDIKNNKSVYFSFIHNNPKNSHLIINNSSSYLISFEKSKLGIPALDIVKFYLFNESLNIDIKEMIINYFNNYEDEFYLNYFYFFVMLYYIKGIVVINNGYITSQSFAFASDKLKQFINRFGLDETSKN